MYKNHYYYFIIYYLNVGNWFINYNLKFGSLFIPHPYFYYITYLGFIDDIGN